MTYKEKAAEDLLRLRIAADRHGVQERLHAMLDGALPLAEALSAARCARLKRPPIFASQPIASAQRFHYRAARARRLIAAVMSSLTLSQYDRLEAVHWIADGLATSSHSTLTPN